jgi:hypothetical protein
MKRFSIRRLLELPPRLIFSKAAAKAASPFLRRMHRVAAKRYQNLFRLGKIPRVPGVPDNLFQTALPCAFDPAISAKMLPQERQRLIKHNAGEACAHRFDLLGSGPVQVGYHTATPGFAGCRLTMSPGTEQERSTLEMMRRVLGLAGNRARLEPGKKILLERWQSYRPIDWQLDFRSGYRWDPRTWYRDISIGRTGGADIKVPWELSRFQHLGAMGLAYLLEETPQADLTAAEFVLQLTDWVVSNLPHCGVNWNCPMETAIRAVNWLWGLKLFANSPVLIPEFSRLINWSLYHHAVYLRRNPENKDLFVGNHYLAGLGGQIYLETACPWLPQNSRWLRSAARELSVQIRRQFHPDGTNFEASTGYHRLTTEILYSAALMLLQLDRERRERLLQKSRPGEPDFSDPLIFPVWFWVRALKAVEYLAALLKPDGKSPQLGDFDNGRFHKLILTASFDQETGIYREEHCDFRPVLAVAGKMFGRDDLSAAAAIYGPDAELLTASLAPEILKKLQTICKGAVEPQQIKIENGGAMVTSFSAAAVTVRTIFSVDGFQRDDLWSRIDLKKQVRQECPVYFPDGGVAVFDAAPFHAVISCSSGSAAGWGVHSHNDILSFELNVHGVDLIVDPGSYVYTASVEERNSFRTTAAHNTLVLPGKEQKRWAPGLDGLFSLPDKSGARVLGAGPGYFCGMHKGYGCIHRRSFYLLDEAMVVEDQIEEQKRFFLSFNLAPGAAVEELSPGCYLLIKGRARIYLEVISRDAAVCGHVEDSYYSPSYGVKIPASRLLIELNSQEAD